MIDHVQIRPRIVVGLEKEFSYHSLYEWNQERDMETRVRCAFEECPTLCLKTRKHGLSLLIIFQSMAPSFQLLLVSKGIHGAVLSQQDREKKTYREKRKNHTKTEDQRKQRGKVTNYELRITQSTTHQRISFLNDFPSPSSRETGKAAQIVESSSQAP